MVVRVRKAKNGFMLESRNQTWVASTEDECSRLLFELLGVATKCETPPEGVFTPNIYPPTVDITWVHAPK